jgi:hypothetical protein
MQAVVVELLTVRVKQVVLAVAVQVNKVVRLQETAQ